MTKLNAPETAAAAPRTERQARTRRAQHLLRQKLEYVDSSEYAEPDDQWPQRLAAACRLADESAPGRVGRMCEEEVLSAERERDLFREMNRLKRRAFLIRERVNRANPKSADLDAYEELLDLATRLRDQIIRSNLRLVYAIVKKSSPAGAVCSFDDLVSDGVCTLMNAVEKFDYNRGFRFSTYAYRSVARTVYRSITVAQKDEARLARDADEWAFEQQPEESPTLSRDEVWGRLREVAATLIRRLDRREQLILRSRYALGAHRKPRSFQDIANRLGISKERVRQLERRANQKLCEMAAELDHDELFSAAMV